MEINVKNKNKYSGDGEYIARPSILGNPFIITDKQSRKIAIDKYALYVIEILNNEGHYAYLHDKFIYKLDRLFTRLIKNQKLNLLCYCSPKPCHGDLIKQLLLNKYYHGSYLVDGAIGAIGEYND